MTTMNKTRIAGCDLGKASACFVTAEIEADGSLSFDEPEYLLHDGQPFEVLARWYREHEIAGCAALGATGIYAAELGPPTRVLPEDACQEAALATLPGAPDALNLVRVGAGGYGVLSRSRQGSVSYLENEKCSSGTGENMQKIAGRFGIELSEADVLAQRAEASIPITARCSVFAKSEMTHYANQGKPAGELLAGFFSSVARNAAGLLVRNRVDGPVYLIGGCARIASFRRALERTVGGPVEVPERFLAFEALGSAILAAERLALGGAAATAQLPDSAEALICRRERRFSVLASARASREKVTIMTSPPPPSPAEVAAAPAVLGLDLGSTGAKAALVSIETGEVLADLYDRTRGNPVDAARRLVAALLERAAPDVRAIGVTGSGREAVATLLRAVFEATDHRLLVVQNEIVAHATAAVRCDPASGEDLSIIEIGGQDAKYARLSGGRIVESDMNKACSAGTGSFLEEQGQLYDVHEIERFVALAEQAERPVDLGQMCTVYVADAGAAALKEGFSLADVFAGFQYSIVHNYLDRVMGQRTLARRIFFQGKPASSPSLAWTLAAVTGREITVPPNPGAMGAWGIGLCATKELGAVALTAAPPLELEAILRAEITGRSEFACRDKGCQTMCPIERTEITVGGEQRVALSGGACPKYELASQRQPKLAREAPDPFEGRARLLERFDRERPGRPTVGIPVTGAIAQYLPWLATLVDELGFSVKVLRSDAGSLAAGEQLCNSFDSCGPTKIAHAICDADVPLLLFPKILDVEDPAGAGGQTCVTEQAMPEMAEQALRSRGRETRVLRPRLRLARGLEGPKLIAGLLELARALGVSPLGLPAAVRAAAAAQRVFERALRDLGAEALSYARQQKLPIVLLCGSLHVIHDRAINATIPTLLRQNGAMAIPVDCFAVPERTPKLRKVYWGDANRYLRAASAAREARDVFPLLLSSFGCGPASFVEQFFSSMLEGYPHTVLESDGHGGTAGFVTRIQAFMQSVQQFLAEDADGPLPDNERSIERLQRGDHRGAYLDRSVRYVFLSSIEYLGPLFAAVYRSCGYDAVAAPPLTKESFEQGRRDCSGKECLSYQMVWGGFREYLRAHPPEPGRETRLVQIAGQQCRAGVFGVKDAINVDKLGLDDRVTMTALRIAGGPEMNAKVWAGLTALDIIRQLYVYHLVLDAPSVAAEVEAAYHDYSRRVLELIERPGRGPTKWGTGGWAVASRLGRRWRALREIVGEATERYARIEREHGGGAYRTLFASGDIMTKGCDLANAGLFHELAARGVRVVAEPTCDYVEFLARQHPPLLFGRGASWPQTVPYTTGMFAIRKSLYGLARRQHPWLPEPDIKACLRKSEELIDLATNGGAALAVGSALHHWDQGGYDGLLMTACWGCDNGLVSESLLRHRREIPAYFFYDDATPIDGRKLSSFAFRLHRNGPASASVRPTRTNPGSRHCPD